MLIKLRKRSVQFIEQETESRVLEYQLLHEGHQRWRKMWLQLVYRCVPSLSDGETVFAHACKLGPKASCRSARTRRDGTVAVSASRTSSAPPRGLSSPAEAGRASRSSSSPAPPRGRSSPAPPRGVLDALPQAPIRTRTRGTAPSASRYAHHSTRNTGRERLDADRGSSYARARAQ